MSEQSKNWYENYPYLQRIYESYQDLYPFPKTWKDFEKWFSLIEIDIPINELKALLKRIDPNDEESKNKAKEHLSSMKILSKRDFNKIWKEIEETALREIYKEESYYFGEELDSKKKIGKKKETKKEEDEFESYDLALDILEEHNLFCPKEYSKSILIYRNGIYEEESEDYLDKIILEYFVEKEINKKLEDSTLTSKLRLVKKYIKSLSYCSILEFDIQENLRNIQNGILDISDLENIQFIDHNPDFKMMIQLPITYDPNAKCDKIEDVFEFVLGEKHSYRLYESIGDSLLGKPDLYQKFDIFVGEGDNGKSTIMNVIREFLGINNTSEISLQELSNSPFAKADLENKLGNFFPDLPSKYIKDVSNIKLLTGDPYFWVNRKYGKRYRVKNHCKNFFSCNKLPQLSESTKAIYRRINLFVCNNIIPKERRDPNILKKLTTEEELSGLLNLALKGLKTLKVRGGYDKKYSDNIEEEYERLSNPLVVFIETYLEYDNTIDKFNEEYYIDKEHFLDILNIWLKQHNQDPIKNKQVLTRQLNRIRDYKIETRDYRKDGSPKHVYIKVKWNDKAIKEFEIDSIELVQDYDETNIDDILGEKEVKPITIDNFNPQKRKTKKEDSRPITTSKKSNIDWDFYNTVMNLFKANDDKPINFDNLVMMLNNKGISPSKSKGLMLMLIKQKYFNQVGSDIELNENLLEEGLSK